MKARYIFLAALVGLLGGRVGAQQLVLNSQINYYAAMGSIGSSADNDTQTMDDPVFVFPVIGCVGYQNYANLPLTWPVGPWGFVDGTGEFNASWSFEVEAWEDDEGDLCSYDSGDQFYANCLLSGSGVNGNAPLEWVVYPTLFCGSFTYTMAGVWCYASGGYISDALNFGNIGAGFQGTNVNRSANFAYGTVLVILPNYGYANGEVYYSFSLDQPLTVTLSTDAGETNFDTVIDLLDSNGNNIASDDEGGNAPGTSTLTMDLCPGSYFAKVRGYNGAANNFRFNLSASTWAVPITAVCTNTEITLSSDQTIDLAPLVAGSTSACGGVVANVSPASIILGPQNAGANPVDITVTNNYGGTSTCTATITVINSAPAPPNDECNGAVNQNLAIGSTVTFTGDNTGATDSQGADSLGIGQVWETFTISECANVVIDYCGTAGPFGNGFVSIFIDCPFTDFIEAASFDATTCSDGNFSLFYTELPAGQYYYAVMNDPDNSAVGPYTINVSATACAVGVEENELSNTVSLYPNPTSGLLNLEIEGALSGSNTMIMVSDVLGRTISTQRAISGFQQVDLSGQPKGIYVVQVRDGAKVTTRRITLQ